MAIATSSGSRHKGGIERCRYRCERFKVDRLWLKKVLFQVHPDLCSCFGCCGPACRPTPIVCTHFQKNSAASSGCSQYLGDKLVLHARVAHAMRPRSQSIERLHFLNALTPTLKSNPPTGIAYLHSLYGLPNVVDSPCRNHGSHGPVPLPCPPLLCFFTGKSEVRGGHCRAHHLHACRSSRSTELDPPRWARTSGVRARRRSADLASRPHRQPACAGRRIGSRSTRIARCPGLHRVRYCLIVWTPAPAGVGVELMVTSR